MLDWTLENLSADDVARLRAIYEPLTESVRALIDATIRTEVGADMVAAAKAEIDAATARLRSEQLDGPYGRFTGDGDQMWGNVVIGVRNPVAPPSWSSKAKAAAYSPTSIWARPTKVRPDTRIGGARPLCSTTSWAPQPAARRSRGSPAPSRCASCVLPGSVGCTRKPGLAGRTA